MVEWLLYHLNDLTDSINLSYCSTHTHVHSCIIAVFVHCVTLYLLKKDRIEPRDQRVSPASAEPRLDEAKFD